MGITMWYASGILGSGPYPYRPPDNKPLSHGEKCWFAVFVFVFFVMPVLAVLVIAWAMTNAPTTPVDCCTLACRTQNNLPQCQ